MRKRANDGSREDDATLFRDAVRDATPLEPSERLWRKGKSVPPLPVQSLLDVHDTLAESLTGPISLDQSIETGEELFYLRDGLGRNVLHKLRRGHWVVQDAVDLHGSNRDEARSLLAEFLGGCLKRGLRCVRVIHGKGLLSPVLILTTCSTAVTKILPSPILPVRAALTTASIAPSSIFSVTTTSILTFGRKSTTYSAPR